MSPPSLDPGTTRRSIFDPPIKLACLSCRASRVRCDGLNPCSNCRGKCRECVYKPSRRGGARVRKKARTQHDPTTQLQASAEMAQQVPEQYMDKKRNNNSDKSFGSGFQNFISPGAGLKHLSEDSDAIFDALFTPTTPTANNHDYPGKNTRLPPDAIVRTYHCEDTILDAYYIFIHPFFPILPPPTKTPIDQAVPLFENNADCPDDGFEPSTPLTLAISAILALIPHPNDVNHEADDSIFFRRRYAQNMAECAMESIEIESELPQSSTEPSKALENSDDYDRQQFHPGVPIELESIIALNMLSVYEYAQRGNLKKMQSRAGQALMASMALSIHIDAGDDDFSEARRRVWWMTYVCVCQGSIVSNAEPTFAVFTPSFTSKYPKLQSDSETFGLFIQAQQAILTATQFVIDLNKAVKANANMSQIYSRMNELDVHIGYLSKAAESWDLQATSTSPLEPDEAVVSRALRCLARIKLNSARIKIHRYCAFIDLPIFSSKHCDLKSKTNDENLREPKSWPSCSCSSMSPATSTTDSTSTTFEQISSDSGIDTSDEQAIPSFTSHQSAKICLRSALAIARSFEDLPYPNPFGLGSPRSSYLSPTSGIFCPRTMPSFACCAMQCAYALLMIDHKTKAKYPNHETSSPMVGDLLSQLRSGLNSISATLENHAIAFEALGGMRDQIRSAIEPIGFLGGQSEQ